MRRNFKNKRIRLLLLILLMVTVGYAFLSTTLKINGTANIKGNTWNIHWDSDSLEVLDGSVTGTVDVDNTGKNLTYIVNLKQPGDYYEFTIDVVNEGTVDGMISINNFTPVVTDENDQTVALPSYLKYSLTYADGQAIEENHKLAKQSGSTPTREKYKITLEFDKDTDTLPDSVKNLTITSNVPYNQADDEAFEREKKTLSTYTITFDANGGNVSPTTKEVKEEGRYGELPVPTKNGYSFLGWYLGNTKITSKDVVRITKNETLEARYAKIAYTITYYLNGGVNSVNNPSGYSADTATITLEEPTKSGYTFTGWTGSNGNTPQKNVIIPTGSTGNKNYTANWEKGSYTITYNLDGGTNNPNNPSTYSVDTEDFVLQDPTKEGYVFKGWTTDGLNTPTKNIKISKGSTGNKEYTANWSKDTYTITYNLDGGTNNPLNQTTYQVDTETIVLLDPTKTGYTFLGWTGSNGTTPQKNVTIPKGSTGNKTYTANWSKDTYTISYTMNGGTNNSNNPTNYTADTATITLVDPTREGYTFLGWTGSNGTTPQKNVTIPTGSTGNKSYTANWSIDTYEITYNLDGGTNNINNPSSYTVETNKITLADPTKSGYTFTGWTTSGVTTPTKNLEIPKGSTGNKIYTANWQINTYTITYNLDGGTNNANNPAIYTIETNTITLADPTKAGYTFLGWTTSGVTTPTKNLQITKGSIGNKTYTANWSKDTYTISYTMNGGTNNSNNPSTYQVDTATITLADASKSGWTFTGWTTSGVTTPTKNLTIPKGSTGDKSYTAHFEKQITLTQKHGSTTTTQNYTLKDSETSHTFTLATSQDSFSGWTFQGWLDDPTPKAPDYGKTANITISADKTVYATYSQDLTATFIDYNGTSKQTRTVSGTAYGNNSCGGIINQYPTVTSLAQSTYTGWTSGGWATSTVSNATSVLASTTSFVLQENKTYYGIYSQGVTLTYAANGGSTTPSTQSGTRKTNSYAITTYSNPSFTLANAITKNYYTFNGWSVSAPISAVKAAGSSITPASGTALTATAQWTPVNYTISYTMNNGTNNSNNPSSYTVESSAITLATPSKTLTFKGNTNSTSGANGTGVTIGSNTTKAQTFKGWTGSNGSTAQTSVTIAAGSYENKSYTANWTAVAGTLPTVTKSNYECGWNTSSTGTTIQYASGGTFPTSAITESMATTVNLYAVCIPRYTVTFNPNGGTVSPPSVTVTSGQTIGTLPTPTRSGYTFDGWYTELTGGTQITSSYIPTATRSVYAHWTQIMAANIGYTPPSGSGITCTDAQCMIDYLSNKLN